MKTATDNGLLLINYIYTLAVVFVKLIKFSELCFTEFITFSALLYVVYLISVSRKYGLLNYYLCNERLEH